MEVKQNATLVVVKGDNTHTYHVPPSASAMEVYEALKEMLAHVYGIVKKDFEATPDVAAPQPAPVEPALAEAPVAVEAKPQE